MSMLDLKLIDCFSLSSSLAVLGRTMTKSLEEGLSTVRTKFNDPSLQQEVKEKAVASWSWISQTANTLWSTACETASALAGEVGDERVRPARPNSPRASISDLTYEMMMMMIMILGNLN